MRACSRLLIALLCTCAIATVAAAQGTTSRLVGTVTDSTGGVLPGATVTVTNEKTGVTFTTVTSGAGSYNFEALVSGTYTVKVELAGFKTFEATGNPVEIGQPTAVNARLEPGELAETVNVVGAVPTVQTATSGNLGSVFQQETIAALPIVGGRGRNPLELVLTQPGVVSGANTGGGTHVYGARDRSWNYTLDGIDVNETSAGGSNFSPLRTNPDSLQEFKVLTGNQTAEYGRNSGGQVAMVTRSGTNQFKGTLFYMMRDPELNANEWETNAVNIDPQKAEAAKSKLYLDMGGFSLGGPIVRNKTFFFGNLQVLRANRTLEQVRTVYTDAARKGNWRYVIGGQNRPAGVTGASVDANGNVLPGVNVGNYSIPGNDPAKIGLDPRIQQYINANMPLPNDFTRGDGLNTAGYRFYPREDEEQYDAVIRIDHVLSARHFVFGRAAWGEQNTLCDNGNAGLPLFPGMPCTVNTYRSPQNYMGSWRWNPSGAVVNEMAIGWNQFFFDFQTPTSDASIPYLSFGDVTSPQENTTWGNKRDLATLQIVDNLSWVTGAHSWKFGTNIRLARHQDVRGSVSGGNATPIVDFSTAVNTVDLGTFGIPGNMNTSVDRPALQRSINYLLGRVGTYNQGFVSQGDVYAPGGTLFNVTARYPEVDFFAQDTWQVRPNFTVDLGLRWEWKLSPSSPDDVLARPNVRVAVGEPGTSSLVWVNEPLYDSDYNNIAPSVGAAWDPGGEGKSVFRGNYRMAFDRINTFAISSAILQSIPGITTGVTNTAYGQAGGRLGGLPVLAPSVTPTQALSPASVSNNTMRVMDTGFETPITHAWALSYQREVWSRTLVELAYIGRKADHLFGAYDVNQAEIFNNGFLDAFNVVKAGGESPLMNQLMGVDSRLLAGETGSQAARRLYPTQLSNNSVAAMAQDLGRRVQGGQTLAQLSGLGAYFFFPYPQYLNGMVVIDSNDWSDYHAFQAKLEKRYSSGYSYLVAYTLARSKDTRSFDPAFTVVGTGNAQSASSTPFNIFDRGLNYARSDFDRTHVFTGQFVVELPFGTGKWIAGDAPGWLNQIIGGWNVASQMAWTSGRPFTVYSGYYTLSNIVQTPANCADCGYDLGGVFQDPQYLEGSGANTWFFDADARAKFSLPAAGSFSNVGRNAFTGPSSFNMNLTLSKRFYLPFSHQLEVRMDATNFTNTPTFGFPTATINSTTFGRIGTSVTSFSRKLQLGVKYIF